MKKVYELAIATKMVVEADSKDAAFEILVDIEDAISNIINSKGYYFSRGSGEVIKEVAKNEEGYYHIDESYGENLK